MKKFLFAIFVLLITNNIFAQDVNNYGIKFSGFVKYDAFYDTRKTVNIREGHFVLYPDNIVKDINGDDINEIPNFNMLSIQSRLKGTITGPNAFGAKTSGILEADFFGNENPNFGDINGFRLRHATIKLNWEKTEILAGQYWHPFFITECFPGVITFNTGSPFQPFSRNPQIRISHKVSIINAILTAYTQRDFVSTGPDGASFKYLQNAAMPDINFQFQIKPTGTEHAFGIGADYKKLKPRMFNEITLAEPTTINGQILPAGTKIKYKVNEKVEAIAAFAYANIKTKPITLKIYSIYAQNAFDMTMIGGYAVSGTKNITTGELEYTPLNTLATWMDITTNGKKIKYGLFAGYTKNMGADKEITTIYARGANIDFVYRIAPRITFISEKVNIAIEPEYTTALYGTQNADKKGNVQETTDVSNIRLLFSMIYNF